MKKLLLLLTMVVMFTSACTEGGVDESDKPQNPTEQPGGGNDNPNPEEAVFDIDVRKMLSELHPKSIPRLPGRLLPMPDSSTLQAARTILQASQ